MFACFCLCVAFVAFVAQKSSLQQFNSIHATFPKNQSVQKFRTMATPKIINFATGNNKKLEEVPACLHANSLHPDQDRPNRFEP